MRNRIIAIICSLLVSGCSQEPNYQVTLETSDGPDVALVLDIEKRLSDDPCLSEIGMMRREYRYSMRSGEEVRELIDIKVQEADWDGLPAGIFVKGQQKSYAFDSRSYFNAHATYHVANDDLDLWACGDNAAGDSSIRHDPRY